MSLSSRTPGSDASWRSGGRGRGLGRGRGRGHVPTPGASQSTQGRQTARRMDLMASVSRSSGLEKDGDDLKNHRIQEEYRAYIQEKIDNVFTTCQWTTQESESAKKRRVDAQENVLILIRKLREGISASARNDTFAREVYETSLYLSILFESPKQTAAVIPHIFHLDARDKARSEPRSLHAIVVALLYQLVSTYPSQSLYHRYLGYLPTTVLLKGSPLEVWLDSLASQLRRRNYAKFDALSHKSAWPDALNDDLRETRKALYSRWPDNTDMQHLPSKSFLFILDNLRRHAGDAAWTVIRSAYRELSCDVSSGETTTWLARSLCLESLMSEARSVAVEAWLNEKTPLDHVQAKEGATGRWIIRKPR